MLIAANIVAALLGVACLASAAGKLQRAEPALKPLRDVGVPDRAVPILGALLLAGGLGLIVGIWWAPLGIAAAVGLVLYFMGAVVGHLRVGDGPHMTPAAVLMVLAILALVLRIAA